MVVRNLIRIASPHLNAVYSWKPRITAILDTVKSYFICVRLLCMKTVKIKDRNGKRFAQLHNGITLPLPV